MAAALQIWSATFSKAFDKLPSDVREIAQSKIDELGARLENFSHQKLQGRSEYKLRVGDYRVLYEFDVKAGRLYLHYVGHRREIYKRS
ncbi:MAG TPA: type II toxin-antitoxin system RelE/ParE family toxin [Candidatus Acidoferrum sp.]|nr:type II toxin-antitoxin system RelE/ParE family toxin [Candidatus Acidoferrum sp.]